MDDQEYVRNLRAATKPGESTWQNTTRKAPAAILGFLLGAIVAALGVGSMLGGYVRAADAEAAACKSQLAEQQNTATVLLEPVSIELAGGMVGVTSGVLPLAPQWIVPGKVQPQSTAAGRAYLWVGKSGQPQGPFVAGVSAHTGASWTFIPAAK